jgi:hypothetical protein
MSIIQTTRMKAGAFICDRKFHPSLIFAVKVEHLFWLVVTKTLTYTSSVLKTALKTFYSTLPQSAGACAVEITAVNFAVSK